MYPGSQSRSKFAIDGTYDRLIKNPFATTCRQNPLTRRNRRDGRRNTTNNTLVNSIVNLTANKNKESNGLTSFASPNLSPSPNPKAKSSHLGTTGLMLKMVE